MKNLLLALCLIPLLAACGPKTTVVLVPDDDGKVGRVAVATASAEIVLASADEYTNVSDKIAPVKKMDQATEQKLFGSALSAQPQKPASFFLYFKSDSPEPDQASQAVLPEIVKAIKSRAYPQVGVIGHTDTMGDKAYNVKLSLARAEGVRTLLEKSGIDPGMIQIFAYGPNDPLVPTGPNVSEPKNRRVEAFVR